MVEDGAAGLRRTRSAAQLLDGVTGRAPGEVVGRLLGVQAQDPTWARLALRARGVRRSAEVDRALTEDRSIVIGWLMRGTLHLVAAEDYLWLLGLTAPGQAAGNLRRLAQEGVPPADAERARGLIVAAVRDEGPLTRPELAERIGRRGIRTEGQAMPHLLLYAALRGAIVAGPLRQGHHAYADAPTWLGEEPRPLEGEGPASVTGDGPRSIQGEGPAPATGDGLRPLAGDERARALARLARRYLAGHGPATERDLATWSGLPLRDARTGLAAIAEETTSDHDGLIRIRTGGEAGDPPPCLLPAYDPYLLGWRDRDFAVPAEHARRVHPGGGVLRAVATDQGEAIGTWTIRRVPTGAQVTVDPFAPLPAATEKALEAEATAIGLFESPAQGGPVRSGPGEA